MSEEDSDKDSGTEEVQDKKEARKKDNSPKKNSEKKSKKEQTNETGKKNSNKEDSSSSEISSSSSSSSSSEKPKTKEKAKGENKETNGSSEDPPPPKYIAQPPTVNGVLIQWKDICYEVPKEQKGCCSKGEVELKRILNNVSGWVAPGEMLAILGPSGAGKTSFLNILAGRTKKSKNKIINGEIKVNGKQLSSAMFKQITGFVAQEDILMGSMTPKESLRFYCRLSAGEDVSTEAVDAQAEDLLKQMGLTRVQNNFIGFVGAGSFKSGIERGLSGGERKRVSVCLELMHNPRLLFLDEPTSGLDSFAAKTVIECIRGLADSGKTVICTIHQPSAELLRLFDKLLILANGNTCYFGPTKKAPSHFASLGFKMPKFTNPADYYLRLVQTRPSELKELEDDIEEGINHDSEAQQLQNLIGGYKESKYAQEASAPPLVPDDPSLAKGQKANEFKAGYWLQYVALSKRSVKHVLREPMIFKARLFQTLFMAVFGGLIFLRLNSTLTDASDRLSGSFFVMVNTMFGGLSSPQNVFPPERSVFFRERGAHMYSPFIYFMAKMTSEFPINFFIPIIYSAICWWMINFNDSFDRFVLFTIIMIIITNVGFGIGMFLNLVVLDPSLVSRLQPLIMIPLMIFAGFFINSSSVPVWLIWIEYISPVKYAFRAMMNVIFPGITITCGPDDYRYETINDSSTNFTAETIKICPVTTGDQYLGLYSFNTGGGLGADMVICTVFMFTFLILSYLLLEFRKDSH